MKAKTRLEKTFQAKVNRDLKKLRNTWFYKASDRVKSGIPDMIACVNGYFVALELKRGEGFKATPLQEYTLEQIRNANGSATVCYPENWDEIFIALVAMSES